MKVYEYSAAYPASDPQAAPVSRAGTNGTKAVKYDNMDNGSREGNAKVTLSQKGIELQKLMERAEKGDKVNLLGEIRRKYGENAVVSLDSSGLEAFREEAAGMQGIPAGTQLSREEKETLLQSMIKPASQLHVIVPNLVTTSKLDQSLKNADQGVKDAANSIIRENLMSPDAGALTEAEHSSLISLGMEKARYLAENYMNQEDGALFLEAMETVAKYGMNGARNEDGGIRYNVHWGPKAGAAVESCVDTEDLMKTYDPEAYDHYCRLRENMLPGGDPHKQTESLRYLMSWERSVGNSHPEWVKSKVQEYTDWEKGIKETELGTQFNNADKTDLGSFMENILAQNERTGALQEEYLRKNLDSFLELLA